MKPALILALLIAGCSLPPPPPIDCPPPIVTPVGAPRHPTPHQIGELEIRVEEGRESERDRGDRCAASVVTLMRWIAQHR